MTRVISISDDAYERLRKLKSEKSFSEVIIELTSKNDNSDLMDFAGELSFEEGEKIKKEIYEERKTPSKRFK